MGGEVKGGRSESNTTEHLRLINTGRLSSFYHGRWHQGAWQRCYSILCTDSYTILDDVRLMNVLMIKYRLECTLRYTSKRQPRIYIRQCSMPLLRSIVIPQNCSILLCFTKSIVEIRSRVGYNLINLYKSLCVRLMEVALKLYNQQLRIDKKLSLICQRGKYVRLAPGSSLSQFWILKFVQMAFRAILNNIFIKNPAMQTL